MAKGQPHSDETRAAVMAALLAGQGVNEIARQYKLNEATVRNWKRQISPQTLTEVNEKKAFDFGQKLGTYLETLLGALTSQAKVAGDETYIREQSASELATLHGVMADKGIRLLEAAQFAPTGPEPEQ